MSKSFAQVERRLDWLMDHSQEDRTVDVGCKTCNTRASLMASTARCAWLYEHVDHEVWMKNPFKRPKDEGPRPQIVWSKDDD